MVFTTKFSLQSFRNQVNELTESQMRSIERAGFGNLLQIPYHVLRRNQLIELMDTWSTEKQAFIFPSGEITITLLDVSLILGLRVIGQPVVLEEDAPLTSLEEEMGASLSNRTISVELLKAKLDDIGKRDDDESFVQVFLLYSFGTLLFPSANGKVDSRYLTLVQDMDTVSCFAWGAAVLKDLHDCLSQRKSKKASNMNGCLILLQIWCYEHIIIGRPKLLDSKFPRICRWESSTRNYSTSHQFAIKFKELEPSQILWMLQPTSEEIDIDIIREIPQEWYLRTGTGTGTIEEPINVESERASRMARVRTEGEGEGEKSTLFVLSDDDESKAIEDLTKEGYEKRDENENEELKKRDEELERIVEDSNEEVRKIFQNENELLKKRVKEEEELRLRVEDENDELRKRVQNEVELRMEIQEEIELLRKRVEEDEQLRKIVQEEQQLRKIVQEENELLRKDMEKVRSENTLLDGIVSNMRKVFKS